MPYYITNKSDECSGWAVIKDDGEVLGCHDTKESAIDQAVAISIDTNEPFEGERAAIGSLNVGDYVSWEPLNPKVVAQVVMVDDQFAVVRLFDEKGMIFTATDKLMVVNVFKLTVIPMPNMIAYEVEEPELQEESNLPDNYRPALADDVPEGRACGNCIFFNEEKQTEDGTKAWCERWDDFVDGGYYCNAWEPKTEDRDINQEAPAYMRAAARRGLEYYEEGKAGDGVTPKTIREAREMAEGRVSDDKWIRIAAWIARHLVDLDSPDADPDSDNYPSAGVVAHLLWGSGPSKRAAQRTKDYADGVVARIRQEEANRMETKNKWLEVARAIQTKIDGPQVKEPELRVNHTELEVRQDGMTFTGYASVFNSPSEDLGGFIEYVAPGAFKRSLQSRNEIKLLWNHDSGEPLASLRGGTLRLTEDSVGLRVEATLPNTTRGRDVAELLRTRVIDSMSFGFNVIKDSWSSDGRTRTLESVRLSEVSSS
jgi:HK97 family phage prohead protease